MRVGPYLGDVHVDVCFLANSVFKCVGYTSCIRGVIDRVAL